MSQPVTLNYVLDYSRVRPTAAQIKAVTIDDQHPVGAICYLDRLIDTSVLSITRDVMAELVDGGLQVGFVFENVRLEPVYVGSHDLGSQHADFAANAATSVCQGTGITPRCVYMAYDIWEAVYRTGEPLNRMRDYARGAHSSIGSLNGTYGYGEIIQATQQDQTASWFWQCGRRSDVGAGVHVWQDNNQKTTVGGVAADINHIFALDWGQHPAPTGAATSTPPPSDEKEMDTMTLFGFAQTPDGAIYKINYLAGTYSQIPDLDTYKAVLGVMDRQYKPEQWLKLFKTDDMSRFGVEIGAAS